MAKRQIFVDTVFLQALLDRKDNLHSKAMALADQTRAADLITTQFVVVELANALSAAGPLLRSAAIRAALDFPGQVLPASAELFAEAAMLYSRRSDKLWSLTDCASFVVMAALDISEALTYDIHFVQAGFEAMLRD